MDLTQENLEKLQADLQAAQAEVEKLNGIKTEIVTQRDSLKKKVDDAEARIGAYEETVSKTTAELEAERKKAADIAAMHASTIKLAAVRQQLETEGVIALETALKLIPLDDIQVTDGFDINKDTVTAVVTKLKETDAVLFRQKGAATVDADAVPKPKRASEGEPKAGYAEELKNCKKASDVEALLRKYGKIA